jgi:diguanylate cyclase (GGDEF)-like protein
MVRAVSASLDPGRVADALLVRASEWVPVSGWLVLARNDTGGVQPLAARGLPPALDAAATAVGGWVIRTGEVFSSADLTADRRLARADSGAPVAAIGFPLESRGVIVGALVAVDRVASAREPRFERATLNVLQTAIEAAAIALDNGVRMQRAEALSVTDDLTQLYNSRYLAQVLRRETKRATRSGRPLSLLFIDLDGFKSINDKHGHLFGSRALVEAASVIRASARETDIVARFGGDEFALVLPDTGSDGAFFVGERIREKIAAWVFLQSIGLNISLTVSVGVATLPDVASSAEQLIQAADEAMYAVKDGGKNGIRVAGA